MLDFSLCGFVVPSVTNARFFHLQRYFLYYTLYLIYDTNSFKYIIKVNWVTKMILNVSFLQYSDNPLLINIEREPHCLLLSCFILPVVFCNVPTCSLPHLCMFSTIFVYANSHTWTYFLPHLDILTPTLASLQMWVGFLSSLLHYA